MGSSTPIQRHRPLEESYRTYGDVRTRGLEIGGSGAPLICLHGYSDQADTWRALMRQLHRTDRHVIAVDLPGFGRAAPLQPGDLLPQLDAFVAELVRAESSEAGRDAIVIGNSLGGVAALRAAGNADLPIAGIVPISPAGFGHSRAIKYVERRNGLLPMIERNRLPMPVMRGAMSVAFRGASCARPLRADREAVRAYANQFRTRADMIRIFGMANKLLAEIDTMAPPATDVPVLLLWGDRDRLTLHRGAERVQAAIPQTELVALHGCGHCPQLEAAPRIAALIARFADRLEATPVTPISVTTPPGDRP